jgi:hypothetical protein
LSGAAYAQIEALLDQLEPLDQLRLIEELARRLREGLSQEQPEPLYDAALGTDPYGLDMDKAIREIRAEWLQELEGESHEEPKR